MSTAMFLDIDRFLGKARNRIYRVGLEMEGGWNTLPEGAKLTPDGSVNDSLARKTGEIVSPPLEHTIWPLFVRQYHPERVDQSCGLHFHVDRSRTLAEWDQVPVLAPEPGLVGLGVEACCPLKKLTI